MLKINTIAGGYQGLPIIQDISFEVKKGEMLGVLGPNGSGKSTMLKMISGLLPVTSGEILLDNQSIHTYAQKMLAKKMAVLPQLHSHAFSYTVRETVALGRYPHQSGFFSHWSNEDEQAVYEAMRQTDVLKYEHTNLEFLSGGERQRVFMAQALAQQAEVLLLDEPTNHLDITHQRQLLDLIRCEALEKGLTVLSVFHDINLAALYCDRVLLLEKGSLRAIGEPHEVLQEAQIREVYEARVSSYPHPELPKPQITLLPELVNQQTKQIITKDNFTIHPEFVEMKSDFPLKTVSSAVHNAGSGWFQYFLNRSVDANYACDHVKEEMLHFLKINGFSPTNTVAMMTAVLAKDVFIEEFQAPFGSVIIAVTAGVGNAVDVSKAIERVEEPYVGTINTWVIVNGKLADEAFIQAMITATEAKTKALSDEHIQDPLTGTVATGTSTDSLLVAATQQGTDLPYAGPITEVGKVIGHGVYQTTVKAIQAYKVAKGWNVT